MKPADFIGYKEKLRKWAKASDSSELKHVAEFVEDIVDNVAYDNLHQCHGDSDVNEILRDDIITSLEEFESHIVELKKFVNNGFKPS